MYNKTKSYRFFGIFVNHVDKNKFGTVIKPILRLILTFNGLDRLSNTS